MYNEHSIVWLEDPTNVGYVRELHTYERTRTEQPSIEGVNGRLVAYTTLDPPAEPLHVGTFERRVWYVAPWDPYEGSGHPKEAKDPYSIAPNVPSSPSER